MTQSFVPDSSDHPSDVNVITDQTPTHGDEIAYLQSEQLQDYEHGTQGTDHLSVTGSPTGQETVFTEHPGQFYTRRIPRTPAVGRTVTRTLNVFGDGVHRLLIGRNFNRRSLSVWTDLANTVPVFVACRDMDSGVGFAPGSLPYEFHSFHEFTVWASANSILYVVEEDYYVNEEGR